VVAVPLGVAVGETVPHAVAEQETVQLTPLLAESLRTVAVNCAVEPASTVAAVWERETLMRRGDVLAKPPPHPELLTAASRTISIAIKETLFFEIIASLAFGLCGRLPQQRSYVFRCPAEFAIR